MIYDISVEKLLELSRIGLFGLINDIDKRVYVSYSTNIICSVSQIIESNKLLKDDVNKLRIITFDCPTYNKNIQKQYVMYYINEYRNKGYTLYHKFNHIRYKVDIEIVKELAYVKLISSNNKNNVVVGVFDDIDKAKEFLSEFYSNSFVYPNAIAYNKLTKNYYKYQRVE